MKKKLLGILFCGILLFGLTGCGVSKEEMIKQSTKLTFQVLEADIISDLEMAKEKYIGNVYEISTGVIFKSDEYAKMSNYQTLYTDVLEVHFSNKTDLEKLELHNKVTIVGRITEITKNVNNNFDVKIEDAFYISNVIEITGNFHTHYDGMDDRNNGNCGFVLMETLPNIDSTKQSNYILTNLVTIKNCKKAVLNEQH